MGKSEKIFKINLCNTEKIGTFKFSTRKNGIEFFSFCGAKEIDFRKIEFAEQKIMYRFSGIYGLRAQLLAQALVRPSPLKIYTQVIHPNRWVLHFLLELCDPMNDNNLRKVRNLAYFGQNNFLKLFFCLSLRRLGEKRRTTHPLRF